MCCIIKPFTPLYGDGSLKIEIKVTEKLAHFGVWEEIAQDWDILECGVYCQKVGRPFFFHKWKLEHVSDRTYSYN